MNAETFTVRGKMCVIAPLVQDGEACFRLSFKLERDATVSIVIPAFDMAEMVNAIGVMFKRTQATHA